jgi:hypothetical protein
VISWQINEYQWRSMSDTSRQKLREIIATYGSAIVDDPRRLKALLKDLCGEHKLEINLLTLAAEQRVPGLLTLSKVWDTQDAYIHSLCNRLQAVQPMSMRSAIWTVRSWMYALGLSNAGSHESLAGNGDVVDLPVSNVAVANGDHQVGPNITANSVDLVGNINAIGQIANGTNGKSSISSVSLPQADRGRYGDGEEEEIQWTFNDAQFDYPEPLHNQANLDLDLISDFALDRLDPLSSPAEHKPAESNQAQSRQNGANGNNHAVANLLTNRNNGNGTTNGVKAPGQVEIRQQAKAPVKTPKPATKRSASNNSNISSALPPLPPNVINSSKSADKPGKPGKSKSEPAKPNIFALPTPMDLQAEGDRHPTTKSSKNNKKIRQLRNKVQPQAERNQNSQVKPEKANDTSTNGQLGRKLPLPALPTALTDPANLSAQRSQQSDSDQQLQVLSDADKRAKQDATVYLDGLFDDYELNHENRRRQPKLDGVAKFRQRQREQARPDQPESEEDATLLTTLGRSPWIALGVGATVLALTAAGYAYNQLRVAELDLENVEMAAAYRSAGNYEACISQAQANASNQVIAGALQNVKQSCQLAQQNSLAAQQLVLAQSLVDSGKLKEAITIAMRVSPETQTYAEAQQLIDQSSQRLLDLAQAFYHKDQLDDAGKMIATIPETSELKGQALSRLALWQQEKQQNELALGKANQELSQGNWRGAIAAAREVTPVPHWQNQAQAVIQEAQSQIVAANQPSQPIAPTPVYNPPPVRRNTYNPPAATYYEPAPRYNPPPAPRYYNPPPRYSPPAPVYNPPPVVPAPSYDPAPPSRAD